MIMMSLSGCKFSNIWIGHDLDLICKSHRNAYVKVQSIKNFELDQILLSVWQGLENNMKSVDGHKLLKKLSYTNPLDRYNQVLEFSNKKSKAFQCLEFREFYVYIHQSKIKRK
jgi:hypothetical protein